MIFFECKDIEETFCRQNGGHFNTFVSLKIEILAFLVDLLLLIFPLWYCGISYKLLGLLFDTFTYLVIVFTGSC